MGRPRVPYLSPADRVQEAAYMADDLATGADWVTPEKIVDWVSAVRVAAAVWAVDVADVQKQVDSM